MTRNKRVALAAVMAAAVVGACSDEFSLLSSKARTPELFTSVLTGAKEVPAVTTTATGTGDVTILDTNLIRVQVNVAAIDSVTQSHIHAGDGTVAGPVMVFLFGPVTAATIPTGTGSGTTTTLNGVLSLRDIRKGVTAFVGIYTFDSLMTRIKAGTAYVNVHTRRNPGGEVRGQIVPK